jgi:hypothetical protein
MMYFFPYRDANILLDFEGLKDQEPLGGFYDAVSITFSNNALGLIDSDNGGTGNFGGEPSPVTVLFWLSGNKKL